MSSLVPSSGAPFDCPFNGGDQDTVQSVEHRFSHSRAVRQRDLTGFHPLHQAVAADLVPGLRKPAVKNQDFVVANLDGRRVACREQTRARSWQSRGRSAASHPGCPWSN
jgi:hypothetical protein